MKLFKVFGVLFLAALAVFFGTDYFLGDDAGKANGEVVIYYQERVKTLESDLANLKSEGYASAAVYRNRITELEELLAGTRGEYTYETNGETVTITQYTGIEKNVSLPSVIDGNQVVEIGKEAFRNTEIESVILPVGIQSVGWFSFSGCRGLKRITIPPSVTSIGYGAFDGCSSITIVCKKGSFAEKYALSYGLHTETE